MEFKVEQLVDSFTKRYIEDVSNKTKDEWFAIFDIINEEYKRTNNCLICNKGRYRYNSSRIACENGLFYVGDEVISFMIKANYCPICGKKISSNMR